MAGTNVDQYTRTYTSFSGCDIVATFNGISIGELQAITYSISREKAPIYTMGSAEPRSFSRGKRGIAGTFVFTVFNRDALVDEFTKENRDLPKIQKFKANDPTNEQTLSITDWDTEMSSISRGSTADSTRNNKVKNLVSKYNPVYADEILPFDICITMANEYGQRAMMTIYGVEILNEGSGYSIDAVTTEKAYTFIARRIDTIRNLNADKDATFQATF